MLCDILIPRSVNSQERLQTIKMLFPQLTLISREACWVEGRTRLPWHWMGCPLEEMSNDSWLSVFITSVQMKTDKAKLKEKHSQTLTKAGIVAIAWQVETRDPLICLYIFLSSPLSLHLTILSIYFYYFYYSNRCEGCKLGMAHAQTQVHLHSEIVTNKVPLLISTQKSQTDLISPEIA